MAYEKSMAGYDDQAARLPQQYAAARNNVAAQDALARKAFDERAAASGLSSGAAGQAELARSSAYQRDIASLDQAQANALSDIDLAKTNLQSQYENAIAQARADGNAALANALYEELVRVQGLNREDEQIAAQREADNLQLALKYGLTTLGGTTGTTGVTQDTGTQEATQDKPVGSDTPVRDKGYDNGSLTASQVKEMQAFYGLTQDGLWGPNSQKTAGSADEAWQKYSEYRRQINGINPLLLEEINREAEGGMSVANLAATIQRWIDQGRITAAQGDALAVSFGF